MFAESGDEGAGAVIAGIESGDGHFFAGGEQLQGVQQAKLLTPAVESHAGFFQKKALDSALAGAAGLAESRKGTGIRWVRRKRFDDSPGARIRYVGQLQGNGFDGLKLVDDAFEDAPLDGHLFPQFGMGAGTENEFAKKRRDGNDGTFSRQLAAEARMKIERPHVNDSRDGDGVWCVGGNPDSAHWRDNPGALSGLQGHDPARGKEELVFGMGVLGDTIAVRKIGGDRGEFGDAAAAGSAKDALALMRHLLSQ